MSYAMCGMESWIGLLFKNLDCRRAGHFRLSGLHTPRLRSGTHLICEHQVFSHESISDQTFRRDDVQLPELKRSARVAGLECANMGPVPQSLLNWLHGALTSVGFSSKWQGLSSDNVAGISKRQPHIL